MSKTWKQEDGKHKLYITPFYEEELMGEVEYAGEDEFYYSSELLDAKWEGLGSDTLEGAKSELEDMIEEYFEHEINYNIILLECFEDKQKGEMKMLNKISVDGNNGGDFIEIQELNEGMVHLKVGSSCVMVIDNEVPVEFVTGIINNVMMQYGGDINKVIDSFGWEQKYKDELKNKVK